MTSNQRGVAGKDLSPPVPQSGAKDEGATAQRVLCVVFLAPFEKERLKKFQTTCADRILSQTKTAGQERERERETGVWRGKSRLGLCLSLESVTIWLHSARLGFPLCQPESAPRPTRVLLLSGGVLLFVFFQIAATRGDRTAMPLGQAKSSRQTGAMTRNSHAGGKQLA